MSIYWEKYNDCLFHKIPVRFIVKILLYFPNSGKASNSVNSADVMVDGGKV